MNGQKNMDMMMNDEEEVLLGIYIKFPSTLEMYGVPKEVFGNRNRGIYNFMLKHREMDYIKMREFGLGDDEIERAVQLSTMCIVDDDNANAICKVKAQQILENYKKIRKQTIDAWYSSNDITYEVYMSMLEELNGLRILYTDVDRVTYDLLKSFIINKNNGLLVNGFKKISQSLKLAKGDVVTVGAQTGYGKSAFLLNVYNRLAFNEKYKCHYFNLEVSMSEMYLRLIAMNTYIDKDNLEAHVDEDVVDTTLKVIVGTDSYIKTGSIDIDELKSTVLSNLDEDKTNIVFIDHVLLLGNNDRHLRGETEIVTANMKAIRAFALDHNLIVFNACQFNREANKSGELSLNSFKSSGEIEFSSTHCITLHPFSGTEATALNIPDVDEKDEVYFYIDVLKNRNGRVGKCLYYHFDKNKQFIREI